jgi:hypothetical protein
MISAQTLSRLSRGKTAAHSAIQVRGRLFPDHALGLFGRMYSKRSPDKRSNIGSGKKLPDIALAHPGYGPGTINDKPKQRFDIFPRRAPNFD